MTAVKDIVFKIIKILLKFIIILIIKVLLNCLFTHDANLLNALLASNKIRKQKKKNHALPHIICLLLTIICLNSAILSF